MNAHSSIIAASEDGWQHATEAVNAWRGKMIYHFAGGEGAVSETLLVMAKDARGGSVALRQLSGQRLDEAERAVRPDGPFPSPSALSALAKFREHEQIRHLLCHGIVKIAIDRGGHWIIVLRMIAFKNDQVERTVRTLEQHEAEQLLTDVGRSRHRLESAFSEVRRYLSLPTPSGLATGL